MEKTLKFEIQELIGIGMVIVVLTIALAYAADVVDDVEDDFPAGSYGENISFKGLEGNYALAEKIPTIAKVAAAAVIIGLLVVYLWGRVAKV